MENKILKEELQRIQEIMGVNSLMEAAVPGIGRIAQAIITFADDAARAGRVIIGDTNEIYAALNTLKSSRGIVDQELAALARLAKASEELAQEILPMIRNVVKGIPNGTQALLDIDSIIARGVTAGKSETEIAAAVDAYIDASFASHSKGLKDLIKQEVRTKIPEVPRPPAPPNIPGTNNPIPTTPMTPAQIIKNLRASFAGNSRAQKLISKAEGDINNYVPQTREDAMEILKTNKNNIQTAILGTKDEGAWVKFKEMIWNNWGTKWTVGFFVTCFTTYIFAVIMDVLGIKVYTPLCNLFDGANILNLDCSVIKKWDVKVEKEEEGALN